MAGERDMAVRAQNLSKAYSIYKKPQDRLKQMLFRRRRYHEDYWALRDVSVEIAKGEAFAVIGHNGSGKSTFLQIVCGALTPTSGTVETRGRIAALLELGAGFNPEFTGRENVFLGASILGLTEDEIGERYPKIVEFAGIGDFIDHPVKLYSSGMYARLAFALAAHVDADILIVDEILAVGDAAFTQKCMRYIRRFKERGTILFVSHDINSVLGLCDRAMWLDAGEARAIGESKDICREYLADLYARVDNSAQYRIGGERRADRGPATVRAGKDCRHELLSSSNCKNVIEVFDFNKNAPWVGAGGAEITDVRFQDRDGQPVATFEGGEEITLRVSCLALERLERPIVGFYVKDRLGQTLFGDNTYISYRDEGLAVEEGGTFHADFRFFLPYLPKGEYAVCAALATGSQEEHTQRRMIDDAVFFTVTGSHLAGGLVGVPMLEIRLKENGQGGAA